MKLGSLVAIALFWVWIYNTTPETPTPPRSEDMKCASLAAAVALTVASTSNAWVWVYNSDPSTSSTSPYTGATHIDLYGTGELYQMRMGTSGGNTLNHFLPTFKRIAKERGTWHSPSFQRKQEAGIATFARRPISCDQLRPCSHTVLLRVDYHAAVVNGFTQERYTMDTIEITRGYATPGGIHVEWSYATKPLPDQFGRMMVYF